MTSVAAYWAIIYSGKVVGFEHFFSPVFFKSSAGGLQRGEFPAVGGGRRRERDLSGCCGRRPDADFQGRANDGGFELHHVGRALLHGARRLIRDRRANASLLLPRGALSARTPPKPSARGSSAPPPYACSGQTPWQRYFAHSPDVCAFLRKAIAAIPTTTPPAPSISCAAARAVAPVSIQSSTSKTRVRGGQGSARSSKTFSTPE